MKSRSQAVDRAGPVLFATLASMLACAGCSTNRGVETQDSIHDAMTEAVQPPAQTAAPFAVTPPVQPAAPAEERFDVNVIDADAREFFMGLVEGTNRNLIVHPDVTGQVTLTLKQVTLPEVLDTVRDVYGYDYRRSGGGYIVLPAALQSRVYEIDYLNLIRSRSVAHARELGPRIWNYLRDFAGITSASRPPALQCLIDSEGPVYERFLHRCDPSGRSQGLLSATPAKHLAQAFRSGDHSRRMQPAGLSGQSFDRSGHADRSDDLAGG